MCVFVVGLLDDDDVLKEIDSEVPMLELISDDSCFVFFLLLSLICWVICCFCCRFWRDLVRIGGIA